MKVIAHVFCGVDDQENCPDCKKALAGNPYKPNKSPIPGELMCGDNCRHALQEQEIELSVLDFIKWSLFK